MRTLITIIVTTAITLIVLIGGTLALSKAEKTAISDHSSQTAAPELQTPPSTQYLDEPTIPNILPSIPEETEYIPVATMETYEPLPSMMPKYYQTDYPYIKFGNGTIATSGCSITCLAMVATYITGNEYYPDQMAHHFGSFGKNNIERLIYGNEQMQLSNTRTENIIEVLNALKEGKIVIAMMDDESVFTTAQHFIVLAGMTDSGKIIVHDPLEKKHEGDVYMENGYRAGFDDYDIRTGFSGAWIYDVPESKENIYIFDASIPEQEKNRYNGYELTDHDNYMLAAFLWLEARNEPEEVQQAIAEVILNRVISDQFPNTVRDVLYKGEFYKQMQKYDYAKPDYPQYRAVTAAMYGPYKVPSDVLYCSVWETNGDVWGKLGSYTFLYSR